MQSTNSEYGSPYLAVCHVTFISFIGEQVCDATFLKTGSNEETKSTFFKSDLCFCFFRLFYPEQDLHSRLAMLL